MWNIKFPKIHPVTGAMIVFIFLLIKYYDKEIWQIIGSRFGLNTTENGNMTSMSTAKNTARKIIGLKKFNHLYPEENKKQ